MLAELLPFLTSTKDVIQTLKEIIALLPEKDKKSLDSRLNLAERELRLSEAQLAQTLDYQLCKCTFPPQIMLLKEGSNYIHQCSLCKREMNKKPSVPVTGSPRDFK